MIEHTIPIDVSLVADKRSAVNEAITALVDTAGAVWFDLGESLERRRFLDILDKLEKSLLKSEEDAIMTIHLIRKMVETDDWE